MKKMNTFWLIWLFSVGCGSVLYGDQEGESKMEIVTRDSFTIMGIKIRTSNIGGCGEKDIPMLWGKFFSENIAEKIPNKKSSEVYGLYTDYDGDHTGSYTLIIGCEVENSENVPTELVVKTIPAASYAVFRATGPFPQGVAAMWKAIWQTQLNRSFVGDFELYGKSFQNPESPEVPIYISLKTSSDASSR